MMTKEVCIMRRIKLVVAALVVMVATFAASASPAMAQTITGGNVSTGVSTIGTGISNFGSISTFGTGTTILG